MKKSKKKLIIILSIILVFVILLGIVTMKACSSLGEQMSSAADDGVQVQVLSMQDLSMAISVNGTVESQNVVSVASDLTYKIKELPVQLGDYVEQGQTLCVFDDTELKEEISALEKMIGDSNRLSLKQSEINRRALETAKTNRQEQLAAAQAEIDRAKAAYDKAKADYDMYGEEYYEVFKEAENAYTTAQNSYKQTERSTAAEIQSCQDTIDTESSSNVDNTNTKQLAELKRKLGKTTITAEQSGIITSLKVNQGSVHAGGELMTIQDSTKMKLVVSLTESDVVKVKTGMAAEITANALGDETIQGTVSKVMNFSTGSTPSEEGGTASAGYSAEILIDNPGNLLLGMTAKARIMLQSMKQVLAVSYDSIAYEDDGAAYVYRGKDNGDGTCTLEKIIVETGVEGEYYTQISSDELKEGDYIISYPDMYSEGDTLPLNPDFLE